MYHLLLQVMSKTCFSVWDISGNSMSSQNRLGVSHYFVDKYQVKIYSSTYTLALYKEKSKSDEGTVNWKALKCIGIVQTESIFNPQLTDVCSIIKNAKFEILTWQDRMQATLIQQI